MNKRRQSGSFPIGGVFVCPAERGTPDKAALPDGVDKRTLLR